MQRDSIGIGIFFIYNKKLFLQLRDDKPSILWPGTWTIIGGGIEPNEVPLQAARREVREELKRRLMPKSLGVHHAAQKSDRKAYYFVRLTKPLTEICEGCAYGYFSFPALEALNKLGEVKGGLGGALKMIFMKYPEELKALLNGNPKPMKKIPEFLMRQHAT